MASQPGSRIWEVAWAPSEGSLGKTSPPALHLWEGWKTSAVWHRLQPRLTPTSQKWWEGGEPHGRAPAYPLPSQPRSLPTGMQLRWATTILPSPYPSPLDASYSLLPQAFRPVLCFSWTFWSALHPITGFGESTALGTWSRGTVLGGGRRCNYTGGNTLLVT